MINNVVKFIVILASHFAFSSMALADTPKCEELLAVIRADASRLELVTTDAEGIEIARSSFDTMTKAMFNCKDTQNLDYLEYLMNLTGTVLKQKGVPGLWQIL